MFDTSVRETHQGEEVVMGVSTEEEEGMMKSRYKRTSSWSMEEEKDLNLKYGSAIFVWNLPLTAEFTL